MEGDREGSVSSADNDSIDGDAKAVSRKRKRSAPAALAPEQLAAFDAEEKRKGVVYLSRIPPFMKPIKIRHLLEKHAVIGRIYLAPEDPAAYKRRIKAGGNKKPQFTEGWVEFDVKRDAKNVSALLNNTPVEPEGSGRGFYASDLWNIKYLKHFKWHHLTEKIAYEQRIRAQKLRAQLSQAKKEAEVYVERAEQAKTLRQIDARKAAGGGKAGASGGKGKSAGLEGDDALKNVRRRFKQRAPLPDRTLGAPAAAADDR